MGYTMVLRNLQLLIITGNPFALRGKTHYEELERELAKLQSAVIINEDS